MSNIHILSEISNIQNIKEITYENISSSFDEKWKPVALENSKYTFAYKITYTSQEHQVKGYIIEPREGDKMPCIIFNRGGSNELGQLKDSDVVSPPITTLVKNGYIVIATQYSGNDGGEGKDEHGGNDVEDVLNLYEILKKYNRADTSRVGMFGASRGGMMAYMILAKVPWIKAAVVQAGTTDLFNMEKLRPEMKTVFERMFGGSAEEKEKRSALYWAGKISKDTPVLIMHGTADVQVDPQDSIKLAEKFNQYGVPHKLIMYEGGDHRLGAFRKDSNQEMINWFKRYLID